MENMVAHNAIIANKQVVDIGHLDIYSILSLLVLKHSQNMGCRQCDMITTPKRRPIVFDRKESYGRYTSQSYLNHRLSHCRVLLSAGKAPDLPRAILHQIRRPDCGTAKGILYSHSPAIKTEKKATDSKKICCLFCE